MKEEIENGSLHRLDEITDKLRFIKGLIANLYENDFFYLLDNDSFLYMFWGALEAVDELEALIKEGRENDVLGF